LPSGEVPHPVIDAITERDARQQLTGAYLCVALAHSMKRSVIHQVLHDREIEIEGSRLEHDSKNAQCRAGDLCHVKVEDPDAAVLRTVQPGNQCKKRAFARAIEA